MIEEGIRRAGPYVTNGVLVEFPFEFKVFAPADIVVTLSDSGVETVLALTSDYTVDLNPNQDIDPGGTLVLNAPPNGPTVTITSDMTVEQPAVFTNTGGFFPTVLNDALDRLTIYVQQIYERLTRALIKPLDPSQFAGMFPYILPDGEFGWASGTGNDPDLRGELATAPGAGLVRFSPLGGSAIPRTVMDKLRDVVHASDFGVAAGNSAALNTPRLQLALDYAASADGGGELRLPPGEILLNGDIFVLRNAGEAPSAYSHQLLLSGAGSGRNGTWLHFTSGSLRVRAPSHLLRDFRVTSDDADGVVIERNATPNYWPVRSAMYNVRAENCELSGFTFSDTWCYRMDNCYARFNKRWGIEGKSGADFGLAVNALEISGGEFQGNGTIEGTPTGLGGSARGSGGGIYTGRGVQINLRGVAIEGNVGDGLKLGEQMRGLIVDGCYFEKNGSHPDNRDICNDQPGSATNGPNSIYIVHSNFTPQDQNGTAQAHAIDLWDVVDLRITNIQVFAQSGPVLYSAEPVRVRESANARARGWVEGGWYSNSGYTQPWVLNETHRFGFPRKHVFSLEETMASSGDTASQTLRVRMAPSGCFGRRVDVNFMTRPDGATGVARYTRLMRRGPASTGFSNTAFDVTYASTVTSVYTDTSSAHVNLPGTHIEVEITRNADHDNDTLAVNSFLQTVELVLYEGRVAAV